MATATIKTKRTYGPDSAGLRLTPREFDEAEFADDWRYELIDGVLVVTPPPLEEERGPNDALGHWLRTYQETHLEGHHLDDTLPEQTVRTARNRRRADRVIWAGLGRRPRRGEKPTIIAEFVSAGKRDRLRDLEEKRDEYIALSVSEYWIIDRFERHMLVYGKQGKKTRKQTIGEDETYTTPLLPGFELPLGKLLALADAWGEGDE
jgi:Uma2 family endonuclease